MTLQNLLAIQRLQAHATDGASIQRLLAAARRNLADAQVTQVAAELLVPQAEFRAALQADEPLDVALQRLARHFKVSTLVLLRFLARVGRAGRAPCGGDARSGVADAATHQDSERLCRVGRGVRVALPDAAQGTGSVRPRVLTL